MPEKTTPNQYLKNLDVKYISLVDAGANRKELVYKAKTSRDADPVDAGSATSFTKQVDIAKTDEEKRLVYCIVYSPDETDAHGDAMKAEEIEKAAHHFLFEGRTDQVDKQHDEDPDEGRIVESYIIGKNDANFPDDPEGSWAVVIKVLDDATWDEVKKGSITGVSMQGRCNIEAAASDEAKSFYEKIKSLFNSQHKTKKDFTERMMHRQIRQAVWAFDEEIMDQLDDDQVDDKKAAVQSTIEEFSSYIKNLKEDTNKQFNPDSMSEKKEKSENKEENELIEKATESFTKALSEAVEPIKKSITEHGETLEGIEKRLKAVEKAAPGSQVEKGQDEKEEIEKGFKGVSVFGNGPKK